MNKITFYWNTIKSTFWFLPILINLIAIAFSFALLGLDQNIDLEPSGLWKFVFLGSPESARSILTTIASAMISVTGTVFSVTLVALTIASNQFGSRLIKNFMHIRLNQVVLGVYIATFLYCLIVLNAIRDNEEVIFIPKLSVFFALLIAAADIILLVFFVHGIAVMIQAENVVANISKSISKDIKTLFPEKIGIGKSFAPDKVGNIKSKYSWNQKISSPRSGYLQYIDGNNLMELLEEEDYLLELHFRPGGHLLNDEVIAMLYSDKKADEKLIGKIKDQFIFGSSRTSQQDIEFSIHQMVEIASRALSPGINDPYTAISCVDNLSTTLSYFCSIDLPSPFRCDDSQNLRIITQTMNFESLIHIAFDQIRQYAEGSTIVLFRLMEALKSIKKFAKSDEQKKIINKHALMVLNSGKRAIHESYIFQQLEENYREVIDTHA